ncbi:unnamed protein product [Clonostachys chloroleuca]|uniref:Uncharacterized protein n=1 Tax=Clonostachys chloroleuca TaxID=1926264 RepID=A0AA35Q787_9HYPO|nr:unnamed protein product [Clonostachys chloroleuca]
MAAYPPGFPAKISTELDREMVNTFQDERLSIRSNDKGSDKAASQNPKSPTWETNKPATPESQKIIDDNGNASRPNKSVSAIEPGQISPRANRQLDAAGTRKTQKERIPPPTKNLNEHLIRGYYKPGTVGVQPRRTLDQYIYADMETLTHRDDDQVVYRYTKENLSVGPKIFIVDQLWLWILGKARYSGIHGSRGASHSGRIKCIIQLSRAFWRLFQVHKTQDRDTSGLLKQSTSRTNSAREQHGGMYTIQMWKHGQR